MKKNTVFKIVVGISLLLAVIGIFLPEIPSRILEVIAATGLLVTVIACWLVPSKEHTVLKTLITITGYLAFLSWTIPVTIFYGNELINQGLQRVSLYNLVQYPYIAILNFMQPVLFILAVGGLYGILNETGAYRNLLEKIAKSMKEKGNLFLILTSLILALLSSIFGLQLMLFIIIPMLCGIIILMGYDKITAFLTTFVSILIGVIGSTYGAEITGQINSALATDYKTELIAKIALFVLTFIIFAAFLIKHANKNKVNTEEKESLLFIGEKKQNKKPNWPILLILGVLLLLLILGCTDWSGVFASTFFTDLHTKITGWTIKDQTVVAYLINGINAFGKWSLIEVTIVTVIASILLCVCYNIKFSNAIKSFTKGAKNVLKPVSLILCAYVVLVYSVQNPILTTIVDWTFGLIKNTSGVIGKLLFTLFSSIFTGINTLITPDLYYNLNYSSVVAYIANAYPDFNNALAVITQSFYGITQFLAPTSIMMLLGLSYLGISYKEWLKNSWKLILQLLAVILVIILVVVLI